MMSKNQLKILLYVIDNYGPTVEQISKDLNIPEKEVKEVLDKLVDMGLVYCEDE